MLRADRYFKKNCLEYKNAKTITDRNETNCKK